MAVSLGGKGSGQGDATATSIATDAFDVQPTAGSTITVGLSWMESSNLTSITDNAGNPYTQFGSTLIDAGARRLVIFRAKNIATVASFVVTANFSSNSYARSIIACEIKGADTTEPNDDTTNIAQSQTGVGTGTDAVTSPSVTTTADGDFVFGYTCRQSAQVGIANGTGFSTVASLGGGGPNGLPTSRGEYLVQGSAGAIAATFTIDGTSNMMTACATFKAAVAGGLSIPIVAHHYRTMMGV